MHPRRRDPDQDTDSQEEMNDEEMNDDKMESTNKLPDLRKKHMEELRTIAKEIGLPEDDIKSYTRWELVQYISRNARDNYKDLYRQKKKNQQELNQEFQKQANFLFNEQCERLSRVTQKPKLSIEIANIFDTRGGNSQILKNLDQMPVESGFGSPFPDYSDQDSYLTRSNRMLDQGHEW